MLRHDLVPVSQSRTVVSCEADAISLPSGEKAIALTSPKWPSSVLQHNPVSVSQNRTVVSYDTDAIILPSGEKSIALIAPE